MSDQRLKFAVFIDFDNVEIGVKTTLGLQFDVGAVLEAIKERGEIITKVAYGDWKRAGDHGRAMAQHAVRLVQRVMTPGGDKNGADINLALDALEMAFTHAHINAFVIVGGDSDFITLVEKLKQYDRKVFVVGGRAFTSQVMQKNCTEFIAYENIAGSGATDRPRGASRAERARPGHGAPLDQALPLVQRALKVLSDREVSPQLGLLKSTLLQLDSSFSEKDYGASTFRDFAEKLEQKGLASLKHSGRTTLVELIDRDERQPLPAVEAAGSTPAVAAAATEPAADSGAVRETRDAALAEGVALVRSALAESKTPPRWPMYIRQMKQFLRSFQPDFDERRYGTIVDLLRAAQKDGLVRLERDRQGGLRLFAGAVTVRPAPVPHGWTIDEPAVEIEPPGETASVEEQSEVHVGANDVEIAGAAIPLDESAQAPIDGEVVETPDEVVEAVVEQPKPARRPRRTAKRQTSTGEAAAPTPAKRGRKSAHSSRATVASSRRRSTAESRKPH